MVGVIFFMMFLRYKLTLYRTEQIVFWSLLGLQMLFGAFDLRAHVELKQY